jgi:hypothetical protein
MDMQQVNTAWACSMDMQLEHAAWPISMETRISSMDMKQWHAGTDLQNGHA